VPDPNPRTIVFDLEGSADEVELRIWTVGLRLVAEASAGPFRPGWGRVAVPESVLRGASGTYYYSLEAVQGSRRSFSAPGRLLILR
jgi:hypothetical protein